MVIDQTFTEVDMRHYTTMIFILCNLLFVSFTGCTGEIPDSSIGDSKNVENYNPDQSGLGHDLSHEVIPENSHTAEPLEDVYVNSVDALEKACCSPENYVNKVIKVRSARLLSRFIESNSSAKFHPMYFLYGYTRTGADLFGFPVNGSSQFQCRNLRFIVDAQDSKQLKVELEKRDANGTREVYCDLSFMWYEYIGPGGVKKYIGKLVWIKFHERATSNSDYLTNNNNSTNTYQHQKQQQQTVTTYQTYRYQYYQQSPQYFRPSDYNIHNPPAVDWRDPIYWNNWPVYRGAAPIYIGP
jgi:hypothetical protein